MKIDSALDAMTFLCVFLLLFIGFIANYFITLFKVNKVIDGVEGYRKFIYKMRTKTIDECMNILNGNLNSKYQIFLYNKEEVTYLQANYLESFLIPGRVQNQAYHRFFMEVLGGEIMENI